MKKYLFFIFFIAISSGVCPAQIPRTIPYQGKISAGNSAVKDGSHKIAISFYDAPIGGALLYSEAQLVNTSDGLYSMIIGSTKPIPASLTFDNTYYCAIAIDDDPEESPRSAFSSTPYALHTNMASALSMNAKIPKNLVTLSPIPGGPAGGDLSGNYPGPIATGFRLQPVTSEAPQTGNHLKWNGKSWNLYSSFKEIAFLAVTDTTTSLSGQGKLNLVTDNTAGMIGDSNYVDLQSDNFIAPEKAIYAFAAKLTLQASNFKGFDSSETYTIGLLKNDSVLITKDYSNKLNVKPFTYQFSTMLKLEAGDRIGLFIIRKYAPLLFFPGTVTLKSGVFSGYKVN